MVPLLREALGPRADRWWLRRCLPEGGLNGGWVSARGCRYISLLQPSNGVAMPRFTNRIRVAEETGQTMAEYGVVLALVTLAVLAALTMLGANVSSALTGVANLLP